MSDAVNPFEPPKASLDRSQAAEDAPPLWNPDVAGAWSLLLTPIFGSVLVRRNWKALGEESKVRTGTIWIVVSVLMLFAAVLFGLAGFLYIIIWYFAWQRPQTQYIRERWGKDYPHKGWLLPLGVGVLVYFGLVALLVFVGFALAPVASRP
jgi:heme/copper-type cytochrome/quinol oxidase subunit 2